MAEKWHSKWLQVVDEIYFMPKKKSSKNIYIYIYLFREKNRMPLN